MGNSNQVLLIYLLPVYFMRLLVYSLPEWIEKTKGDAFGRLRLMSVGALGNGTGAGKSKEY